MENGIKLHHFPLHSMNLTSASRKMTINVLRAVDEFMCGLLIEKNQVAITIMSCR